MAKVLFRRNNELVELITGDRLLSIDDIKSSLISFGCMRGTCGMCTINVFEGDENLSEMGERECNTLKKFGHCLKRTRLACQCSIKGDIVIEKL